MNEKRQHRKQKTAADIRAQIAELQAELDAKERAEREKIGEEMQRLTGKEKWEEIKNLLGDSGSKLGENAHIP